MFVQEGMHLHRKTSAAHGQQPPFVCLSLEGSPSRAAAAALCLRFITGKTAHRSPAAPEANRWAPLLILTSIMKGATSVCKKKEKKGKGLGHVSHCPSLQWL